MIKTRPQQTKESSIGYRGRFAPSPSGLLHFGSLIAALASFLDAKHNHGKWLIRVEDIDPPRQQQGASKAILQTLEHYGLHWDEQVLYQSQQSQYYEEILSSLTKQQLSYRCDCTRANIKANGGIYQGHCRTRALALQNTAQNTAIRVINDDAISHYHDLIQGDVYCDQALAGEDFIVKRKDGLYAYQLAVVADDIYQNISHVIRGCDLLEPTARQLSFYKILHNNLLPNQAPKYGHVPLAITEQGYKLSKQNKAPAIDNHKPVPSLLSALQFLGQQPDPSLKDANRDELLAWAIQHWSRTKVPKAHEITLSENNIV